MSRRSKVKQAELRREQATVDLSTAQRTLLRNLHAFFEEAQTAREEVDLLRHAVDLASESLRLNTLRYQAGEADHFGACRCPDYLDPGPQRV